MNKRQRKKQMTKIVNRVHFFRKHLIIEGRRNGRTVFAQKVLNACYSKKYKPFEKMRKKYNNIFISYDLSNGKDFSAKVTARRHNGIMTVEKVEVM